MRHLPDWPDWRTPIRARYEYDVQKGQDFPDFFRYLTTAGTQDIRLGFDTTNDVRLTRPMGGTRPGRAPVDWRPGGAAVLRDMDLVNLTGGAITEQLFNDTGLIGLPAGVQVDELFHAASQIGMGGGVLGSRKVQDRALWMAVLQPVSTVPNTVHKFYCKRKSFRDYAEDVVYTRNLQGVRWDGTGSHTRQPP